MFVFMSVLFSFWPFANACIYLLYRWVAYGRFYNIEGILWKLYLHIYHFFFFFEIIIYSILSYNEKYTHFFYLLHQHIYIFIFFYALKISRIFGPCVLPLTCKISWKKQKTLLFAFFLKSSLEMNNIKEIHHFKILNSLSEIFLNRTHSGLSKMFDYNEFSLWIFFVSPWWVYQNIVAAEWTAIASKIYFDNTVCG